MADPEWNRLVSEVAKMQVSRTFKGDDQLPFGDDRIEFVMRWRENYLSRPTINPYVISADFCCMAP